MLRQGPAIKGRPSTFSAKSDNGEDRCGSRGSTSSSPVPARASDGRSRERLRAEGATLTLLARDRRRLDEVGRRARRPCSRRCDIRERDAVTAAFDAASADRGPLHALVANAGVGGPNRARARRPLRRARGHEPHRHLLLLPRGASRSSRTAATSSSSSSILARIAVAGYTGYCASKAGLLGLVRSLAAELAPRGRPGERHLPGLGRHGHVVAGLRRAGGRARQQRRRRRTTRRCGTCRSGGWRSRTTSPAPSRGCCRRRARRHRAGDRPERRRLDGVGASRRGGKRLPRLTPETRSASCSRRAAPPRAARAPPRCPCAPGP